MSARAQTKSISEALPAWLEGQSGRWIVRLHVQPGARHNGLAGVHGDALKLKVAAPPVDGLANEAVLAYLACVLSVPVRSLQLVSGASSRNKRVSIALERSPQVLVKALLPGDP